MTTRGQLVGLAQQTMRELGLTPPLDVDLLCQRLGERRGKPIDIVPSTRLGSRYGITATKEGAPSDVIMYDPRTTWTHKMLIILHEIGHMICQHAPHVVDHTYRAQWAKDLQSMSPESIARLLGPDPGLKRPGWRRRQAALRRSLYDQVAEWEAETMATIMIEWVPGCGGHVTPRPADELQAILGDVPAW